VGQCLEPSLRRFTLAATDDGASAGVVRGASNDADKPAESWTDEDVTGFEVKLSDIARRFKTWKPYKKWLLPPVKN